MQPACPSQPHTRACTSHAAQYLGLRIFAHPWRSWHGETPGSCTESTATIRELNEHLMQQTARLLSGLTQKGRCGFNLTLINLLEEHEERGGPLRNKAGVALGTGEQVAGRG